MTKIILGRDNYVGLQFGGIDLEEFDSVQATFGSDTRDSITNPASVVIQSSTELRLFFGDTTEVGNFYWEIVGFNPANPNGLELTSECLSNLDKTQTC